ncbi:hypothetical protein E3P81_00018 [Wallemia ichthyophaga]|nr:hypothetical protein E3P85_00018 [Wallemia ichthyophaga]TIB54732.1 hypothetical protein E3P81_00018 [Wallemia ichthyophaga]
MKIFRTIKARLMTRVVAFYLAFYGVHLGLFVYGWWSQQTNERLAGLNKLGISVWASRGAGLVLALDGGLILLPMLKNLIHVIRSCFGSVIPLDEPVYVIRALQEPSNSNKSWFHKQVAYMLLLFTIIHVTSHYVNFINVERMRESGHFLFPKAHSKFTLRTSSRHGLADPLCTGGRYNRTYHASAAIHKICILPSFRQLAMFIMFTTAHASIRHQKFELFWYTHQVCALVFMLALFTHATGCFVRDTPAPDFRSYFPYYSTEHCLGYESGHLSHTSLNGCLGRHEHVSSKHTLQKYLFILETRLRYVLQKYKSGQYIWIQVPEISKFHRSHHVVCSLDVLKFFAVHNHIVSLVLHSCYQLISHSAPEDEFISVHVRQVGDFSKSLGALFGVAMNSGTGKQDDLSSDYVSQVICNCKMPKFLVDGPYGAPADHALKQEVVVLVGAGIGVTPFASILKSLWYRNANDQLGTLKRVEFYWICRETESLIWFKKLLIAIEEGQQMHSSFISINIYLTRWEDDMIHNITLNDVLRGAKADPLTSLRARTRFGRPDWRHIYSELKRSITQADSTYIHGREARLKTNIATFFCGPGPLGKSLQEAIKSVGKDEEVEFR